MTKTLGLSFSRTTQNMYRLTSGTCTWTWAFCRKSLSAASWERKVLATVCAIWALSFITSPRCPVTWRCPPDEPVSLPLDDWSRGRVRLDSMYSVEPPDKHIIQILSDWRWGHYWKMLPHHWIVRFSIHHVIWFGPTAASTHSQWNVTTITTISTVLCQMAPTDIFTFSLIMIQNLIIHLL